MKKFKVVYKTIPKDNNPLKWSIEENERSFDFESESSDLEIIKRDVINYIKEKTECEMLVIVFSGNLESNSDMAERRNILLDVVAAGLEWLRIKFDEYFTLDFKEIKECE